VHEGPGGGGARAGGGMMQLKHAIKDPGGSNYRRGWLQHQPSCEEPDATTNSSFSCLLCITDASGWL